MKPSHPLWLRSLPASLRSEIERRPNLRKILSNVAWLSGDKIVRVGIGLLVGVWVARYLGPQQFGLLSFSMAFVSLFGAIATLGLQGIVVRDIVKAPRNAAETLGTSFVLQLLGGTASCVLLVLIIGLVRADDALARTTIAILGPTLILKASESVRYWFESQVQSKYAVWVENAVLLVIASIKIGLILGGAPFILFVWIVLAEALAVALLLFAVYARTGGRLGAWRPSYDRAKALLKDSWPLILAGLAVMVYMRIDQIMLGQMLDDQAVGIYTVAVRISELWYFVPMTIVASVFPALIEAKKTSEALYLERLQKLYDLLVKLALAVAVPMTFLSNATVVLLFGQEYAEAGKILAIHVWTALFVFLGVASGKWFLVENRQLLAFQRVFAGMLVNIALNFMLIPRYGGMGAAVATLLSQAVAALFIDALHKDTRPMFRMKLRACLPTRGLGV
ncbi:MAG: flippase [Steroidobacteraceae bacterium]